MVIQLGGFQKPREISAEKDGIVIALPAIKQLVQTHHQLVCVISVCHFLGTSCHSIQ